MPRLGRGVYAFLDQVVVSAANFLTMIFVARALGPTAFGGFSITYSLLLLAENVQSGLLTQAHNVLGSTRQGPEYHRYTTSTGLQQLILAMGFAVLGLIIWGWTFLNAWSVAPLFLASIPALMGWQLQEFTRRVFYTEGRIREAFISDLVRYGGTTAAVLTMWWSETLTGNFCSLCIVSLLSSVVCLGSVAT